MSEVRRFFELLNQHANGLEMLQVTVALIGTVFSIWALLDAVKDSMALHMSGVNGPRGVIARGNILNELERTLVHHVLLFAGIASIFLPPPHWPATPVPPSELLQHTIMRIGMITITVMKFAGALRQRRERTLFIRQMRTLGKPNTTKCSMAPPPGTADMSASELAKLSRRKDDPDFDPSA